MQILLISFLVFSVNVSSFPRDLQNRSPDDFDLAFDPEASDTSMFTSTDSADDLSNIFDSDPGSSTVSALGETDVALTPPDYVNRITSTDTVPPPPECGPGTKPSCCFHGDMSQCVPYSPADVWCYYTSDHRCCAGFDGLIGVECVGPSSAASTFWDGVMGTLRLEVPSDWIVPTITGGGAIFNGP